MLRKAFPSKALRLLRRLQIKAGLMSSKKSTKRNSRIFAWYKKRNLKRPTKSPKKSCPEYRQRTAADNALFFVQTLKKGTFQFPFYLFYSPASKREINSFTVGKYPSLNKGSVENRVALSPTKINSSSAGAPWADLHNVSPMQK